MLLLYIVLAWQRLLSPGKKAYAARYFLICIFLLIIFNFYLAFNVSWESDFQPQGRYLFPSLNNRFLFGQYGGRWAKAVLFADASWLLPPLRLFLYCQRLAPYPKG